MAKCLSVEWVDFCRVNCISPGFIATDILDIHPKEWREKWYDMVPASRFAQAYELKGVCVSFFPCLQTIPLTRSRPMCFVLPMLRVI